MEMVFVMVSATAVGSRLKGKWLHIFGVFYPICVYVGLNSFVGFSLWNSFVLSVVCLLMIYMSSTVDRLNRKNSL